MSAPTALPTAWPTFEAPEDVERIEAVPLAERDLPATTYQVLRRAAGQWSERVAVSVMPDATRWREAASLTYAELLDGVDRVANALVRRGVTPTTPVAIVAPNCLQLVPAMLGVQAAGVAVPLNGGLSAEHLATLLERAGVRHAVVASSDLDGGIWDKVSGLAAAGHLDHLYLLDPTDRTRTPVAAHPDVDGDVAVEYLADAAAAEQPGYDDPHTSGDIAAVFHTGGTTGIPKLAAHTHANQVIDAWLIAADSTADSTADTSGEPATILGALPLFHVNALHVTMLAPMLKGQRVVWAGPLGYRDPALYSEIWKIVEHYSVATMSAVPTVYAVLAGCPVDADISSLRFAVVGASALPPAVRTAFENHTGVPLLEGYGLTEGTCASARSFVSDPRPGSVGKRLPYQQLRVVDVAPDGSWTDVPAGAVGTLLIGGPTVFAGYVTGRGDDGFVLDHLGKVRDGWLDTGDLARIDDGFLHLTGRAKDLIIRGGHNIDPAAIEDALRAHPAVADAAAVGRPDPRAGEVPVAYVTVAAGTETSAGDLEAFVAASSLEPAARPKSVTILDALPVTDVGKPYKLALRADAARRAVEDALADLVGVTGIEGLVADGSVRVVVTVGPDADAVAVRDLLDQFALASEVVAS
ncbi:fatty-acyl-CoA synthase [Nocardioides aromaticivorans]|uniref:Fatty-acyl-CoA synthase n=1 Tax=Nocardioides aromaticivorans TaxID=200618 RepID=A0A7Z0CK78_9ACTN|nr:acyl-CoA synthetase [Nocardioides aromaticivorans]NYI44461.1 fatty-acyl-CoA synthase [Nocardioides aromaticivorans]